MKMYSIKKGTKSIVLNKTGKKAMNFSTTKDLEFFDTVIDPIRFANQHTSPTNQFEELASKGYAIFCAEDYDDIFLAVEYNLVKVA